MSKNVNLTYNVRLSDKDVYIIPMDGIKTRDCITADCNKPWGVYTAHILHDASEHAKRYYDAAAKYAKRHECEVVGTAADAQNEVYSLLDGILHDAMDAIGFADPCELYGTTAWRVVNLANAKRDNR